jgi:hypothetical protein
MSATLVSLHGASGAALSCAEGIWSPVGMRSFCDRLSPALRRPPETLLCPPTERDRIVERSQGNPTDPTAGGLPPVRIARAFGPTPIRREIEEQARTGDEYDGR